MAYVPNTVPTYSLGPIPVGPVVLPSAAKTVFTDNSNAIQILAAMANNRQIVQELSVEVVVTNSSAGKLAAYLYNATTTTAYQICGVQHSLLTATTTAEPAQIAFPITVGDPLIVPEGWSLWVATLVAQPANSLIAYGTGKLF